MLRRDHHLWIIIGVVLLKRTPQDDTRTRSRRRKAPRALTGTRTNITTPFMRAVQSQSVKQEVAPLGPTRPRKSVARSPLPAASLPAGPSMTSRSETPSANPSRDVAARSPFHLGAAPRPVKPGSPKPRARALHQYADTFMSRDGFAQRSYEGEWRISAANAS